MNPTEAEPFEKIRAIFLHQLCIGIDAGSPRGSHFRIDFDGETQAIDRAPNILGDGENGDFGALVTCEWKLYQADELVTNWTADNSIVGSMVLGLQRLIGQKVQFMSLSEGVCSIDFTSHFRLICNMHSEENEDYETVMFLLPKGSYGIAKSGKITLYIE